MSRITKYADVDDESYMLISRIRLTKNEYNAAVRNKIEYNRLKVVNRHIDNESSFKEFQIRRSIYDLKQEFDDNRQVVCDLNEYFLKIKVPAGTPYIRSHTAVVHSDATRQTRENLSARIKSASANRRPFTAPAQTLPDESYIDREDAESGDEDEVIPVADSRLTSAKPQSSDRMTSGTSRQSEDLPADVTIPNITPSSPEPNSYRITWPVQLRVFAVQDEDEYRQQFLAWRAEKRSVKSGRQSKQLAENDFEKTIRESNRRRKEIESFITPEIIEEHQLNDPVFAKRYRQLKLAVRAGKAPNYDPTDREIHVTMNKAKIERTRAALMTARQNKIKSFYQNQLKINDAKLSRRVDNFLKRIDTFKEEQNPEEQGF